MRRICFWFLAFFLLGVRFPATVLAQGGTETHEVVVTATRVPEAVRGLPVTVQVITREEIEKSGATNLSELLAQKHTGHLHTYPGLLSSVGIRGFRTDTHGTNIKGRVLILIDGHRAGTGNIAAIPLENVERIEIVKGPGSVVYGSAAMGGIINIITRKGQGKIKPVLSLEDGDYGHEKESFLLSGGFLKNKVGFSLAVRRLRHTDYDIGDEGDHYQNTAYHDEASSLSFTYTPVKGHQLSLVWQYFRAWDVGSPGPTWAPDPDDYKDMLRRYVSVGYDGGYRTLKWHLSYYYVWHRDQWNDPQRAWGYYSTTTETQTQGGRSSLTFPAGLLGTLVLGVDYDRIDLDSYKDTGTAPWNPNARYENYAFFVEERKDLADNLIFRFGMRYDYFEEKILPTRGYTSLISKEENFDHLSWRGGVTYFVTDWLSLRAALGTAFRIPTADEFSGRYEGAWNKILGNPDLDPEKSTTWEIGLDGEWKNLDFGISYFYTNYDDRIAEGFPACVDGDCSWTTFKNVDGAKIAGLEGYLRAEYSWHLADQELRLTPRVNFTFYTKRKIEDERWEEELGSATLPYVSSAHITADLGIEWNRRLKLNLNAFYVGSQKVQDWKDWTSPTYGKNIHKGGFTVFSASASALLLSRGDSQLELYLRAENLGDKHYAFVRGYPMPGRQIILGIKGRF